MPPAKNTNAYTPPKAPLGIVKWSPGLNCNWFTAMVTQNVGATIRVMVFPIDSRVAIVKDGVRFHEDPLFPKMHDQTSGIWDFTDEYKLLAGLSQLLLVPCLDPSAALSRLLIGLDGLTVDPSESAVVGYSDSEDNAV